MRFHMQPPPRRILVLVGRDLVGDALIKLPFVRALKAAYPEAALTWATSEGPTAYSGALRRPTLDLIDAVLECPPWLPGRHRAGKGEPAADFDLVLDTRNHWREAIATRNAVAHRLFIAPAARYLFSDRRPGLFTAPKPHLVDRLLEMVRLAAGQVPTVSGSISVDLGLLVWSAETLPPGPRYVGLAPGAGNRAKVWPLERFVAIARLQLERGRLPVFILGPDEQPWAEPLREAVPEALFPLPAAPSVEQTMAIGTRLAAAVANDSGTGHMLAAADCALLSLFGPTAASKLAPRVSHGRVLTGAGRTMAAISIESVDEALEALLQRPRAGSG
jgi:ADP-heptose:LPS heptosyltransferase